MTPILALWLSQWDELPASTALPQSSAPTLKPENFKSNNSSFLLPIQHHDEERRVSQVIAGDRQSKPEWQEKLLSWIGRQFRRVCL
jgi:hypothetical protein